MRQYGALPRWIPLLLCIATVGARCEKHAATGAIPSGHSGRAPELAAGQRPAHNTPDATSGTFASTAAARRLPVAVHGTTCAVTSLFALAGFALLGGGSAGRSVRARTAGVGGAFLRSALALSLLAASAHAQCTAHTDCDTCFADGQCFWYPTSATKCQEGQGPDAEGHLGQSCNPSCASGASCSECSDSTHCTRASCSWNPSGTPQCSNVPAPTPSCSGHTDCASCYADGQCYWYPTSTTKCQNGEGPDAEGHLGQSCNPSCSGAQCSECSDTTHCERAGGGGGCSWNYYGTPQCKPSSSSSRRRRYDPSSSRRRRQRLPAGGSDNGGFVGGIFTIGVLGAAAAAVFVGKMDATKQALALKAMCLLSAILGLATPQTSEQGITTYLNKACDGSMCTTYGSDFMGQQTPFPGNVKAALAFCCIALILAVAVAGLHFTGLRQKADGLLVFPMALSFILSFSLFAA